MQKTHSWLAAAAGLIFLTGCSVSPINDTRTFQTENTVQSLTETAALSSAAAEASSREHITLPQMIYVGDTRMTSTGRAAVVSCATADGTIEALVPDDQYPSENGQANFDCKGMPYILLEEGAAALALDDTYMLFLADDVVEYEGIYKKKNEVSEDTLKWLNFYYALSDTDRAAINMVPSEFTDGKTAFPITAMETAPVEISYTDALTEEELLVTEALAQQYFTEDAPVFEGVDQIYPVNFDDSLYGNAGLEGEYTLGNIIIYKVLTVKDRRDGNPFRFISIARNTKSDDWKIINSGY